MSGETGVELGLHEGLYWGYMRVCIGVIWGFVLRLHEWRDGSGIGVT